MKGFYFMKGVKMFFMMVIFIFVVGGIVMFLWNALMPTIFGLTTIGYLQAIGLLALAKIFFSGFGGGRGMHSGRHDWKNKMKHRWDCMSDEQKEKMKNKMGDRFAEKFGTAEGDDSEYSRIHDEDGD